ncbi:MAG: hypothetical protein HFJ02_00510 [Bacilli bacterium]|nr:hypothetical protein [Bacilli bacterium]
MKYINKDNFLDMQFNYLNMSLLETKGLANSGKVNDHYYLLQSKLYYYLEQILNKKLELKEIENLFKQAQINPVMDDEKDIYQDLAHNKYFYIRNNFYVENFMVNEINKILNSNELTEEVEKLILDNLKKILVPSDLNGENLITNYGPNDLLYSAPVDCIVLGLRFSEDYDESLSENEQFKTYCEKREKIEQFKSKAEEVFEKKIHYGIKIIEYFTDDIKKRKL